jgi:hypothetical protein
VDLKHLYIAGDYSTYYMWYRIARVYITYYTPVPYCRGLQYILCIGPKNIFFLAPIISRYPLLPLPPPTPVIRNRTLPHFLNVSLSFFFLPFSFQGLLLFPVPRWPTSPPHHPLRTEATGVGLFSSTYRSFLHFKVNFVLPKGCEKWGPGCC